MSWTAEDRRRAIQWRNHGRSSSYIAQRLGRDVDAVESLLESSARKSRPKKERVCLTCRKPFAIKWEGNHICPKCTYNINAGRI